MSTWNRYFASITSKTSRPLGRLFLLAGILAAESFLLASVPHDFSLLGPFARFGIAAFAVYLGLGFSELKGQSQKLPFSVKLFLAHLGLLLALCLADIASFHGFGFATESALSRFALRVVLLVGIALLSLACIPLDGWIDILHKTTRPWLYASLAGALASCLRSPTQIFWDTTSSAPGRVLQILTFHCVKAILGQFLPDLFVDPSAFVIGTQSFSVFIAKACSGLEGLGLVLVFTASWLWYFRKESRFPQALLLIPCALILMWSFNVLRISALVLIGNAGYGDIAMVGFHSQAGWIAFTLIGISFSMATRKLRWVRKTPVYARVSSATLRAHANRSQFVSRVAFAAMSDVPAEPLLIEQEREESGESPAIRAYLVPFLAILAASFLTKAASGQFEWLYPLRFVAAAIGIWYFLPQLKRIDWHFGWLSAITGAVVFLIWIVPSLWAHTTAGTQLGQSLATLPPVARWAWIAVRVAAAVITVPIAEELAFRGYLARRLVNREFDAVPFYAVTALSIGVSSVVFGLMHGRQWIEGTLAGVAYALVMKRNGRLGDAVVAHAVSNSLLAAWVLLRGDWSQW